MIAALGIVLRGASFAFRKVVVTTRNRRLFGAGFAASSVLVPYCMGAIVGGIASGRVPAGGQAGDPVDSWINPTSVVGGILAVATAAYLSAVYLVWDARRLDQTDMAEYFRRRAVAAAVVVAVIAAAGAVRAPRRCRLPVRRSHLARPAGADPQRRLRRRRSSCCWSAAPPVARGHSPWSRSPAPSSPGVWRSRPTSCRRA